MQDALRKAREYYELKEPEPYYNENGLKNPKHPANKGFLMDEGHYPDQQPYDLNSERPDWRDSSPE